MKFTITALSVFESCHTILRICPTSFVVLPPALSHCIVFYDMLPVRTNLPIEEDFPTKVALDFSSSSRASKEQRGFTFYVLVVQLFIKNLLRIDTLDQKGLLHGKNE